jgi:hypothetical protein
MHLQVVVHDNVPSLYIEAGTPEERVHLLEDLERVRRALRGTGHVGSFNVCGMSQTNAEDGALVCLSLNVDLALGGATPRAD